VNILLKQLKDIKDKVFDVNGGGCGVLAYGIKLRYGGKIVYVYHTDFEGTEKFTHIVIELDDILYDVNGVYTPTLEWGNLGVRVEYKSVEFLLEDLSNVDEWSEYFNRGKDIQPIEQILGVRLDMLKPVR